MTIDEEIRGLREKVDRLEYEKLGLVPKWELSEGQILAIGSLRECAMNSRPHQWANFVRFRARHRGLDLLGLGIALRAQAAEDASAP